MSVSTLPIVPLIALGLLSGCYASHRGVDDRDAGSLMRERDAGAPDAALDARRSDGGPADAGCPSTRRCGEACCAPSDVCVSSARPQFCCPRPYHVATRDGRCVWSCAAGTMPEPGGTECICQPGLVEVGMDGSGRRICS